MPENVLALLLLVAGGSAERYFGRLLADAAAVYLARRDCSDVESWLRRHDLCGGP